MNTSLGNCKRHQHSVYQPAYLGILIDTFSILSFKFYYFVGFCGTTAEKTMVDLQSVDISRILWD